MHLVTHGLYNEERPQYSGLVLAPSAEDDGFLDVSEIFALDLDMEGRLSIGGPGLDLDAQYRVEHLAIPYERWGSARTQASWLSKGITLSGRQLAFHGLQPPTLHPESAVLFKLTRIA